MLYVDPGVIPRSHTALIDLVMRIDKVIRRADEIS